MVKYKIEHRMHYVYNYADKTWHEFDNRTEVFNFIKKVIGG